MIDTKELRRLAQAATHPMTKGRWVRLFGERTVYDRLEDGCRGIPVVSTPVHPPHQFESACLDFIAAANPAAITELLDRLEDAESDALEQARLNGMGSEREAALMAKLEAAEKERDNYKSAYSEWIEKTECVQRGINDGTISPKYLGWYRADVVADLLSAAEKENEELRAKIEAMEQQEPVGKFIQHPSNGIWEQDGYGDNPDARPLYALPGAKGEEK